jgi:predicted nuclease with TOPRIM domain
MYVQNMYALKQKISEMETENDKLQKQMTSATAIYEEEGQRRDRVESKLAKLERSSENTLQKLVSTKASDDALI